MSIKSLEALNSVLRKNDFHIASVSDVSRIKYDSTEYPGEYTDFNDEPIKDGKYAVITTRLLIPVE